MDKSNVCCIAIGKSFSVSNEITDITLKISEIREDCFMSEVLFNDILHKINSFESLKSINICGKENFKVGESRLKLILRILPKFESFNIILSDDSCLRLSRNLENGEIYHSENSTYANEFWNYLDTFKSLKVVKLHYADLTKCKITREVVQKFGKFELKHCK